MQRTRGKGQLFDYTPLRSLEKYAAAASGLTKPSSAARALFAGATNIERVDLLVRKIAAQFGIANPVLDKTVLAVDQRLELNRASRSSEVTKTA